MQPIHFGKTKRPVNPLIPKRIMLQPLKDQALIVIPKGERLNITPIFDYLFVAAPEDNNPTPGMDGGIHLPENAAPKMPGYAVSEVLDAGPACKHVAKGDRVVYCVVHADKFVIENNAYWRLAETAVMGVVRK